MAMFEMVDEAIRVRWCWQGVEAGCDHIVSILVIHRLHIDFPYCQCVMLSPAAYNVVVASSSRDARVSSGSGSSARCFPFSRSSMSLVTGAGWRNAQRTTILLQWTIYM
jgi:hypothetical protein